MPILVCQPLGVKRLAAVETAVRHGFRYFEASTNLPPPTWRLLPCGAGRPTTLIVKLSLKIADRAICYSLPQNGYRDLLKFFNLGSSAATYPLLKFFAKAIYFNITVFGKAL